MNTDYSEPQTAPTPAEDSLMEQNLQQAYEQAGNRIEQLQYELRVQQRVQAAAGAALKHLNQDESMPGTGIPGR